MKHNVMGTPPNPFKKGGPETLGAHFTKRDGEEPQSVENTPRAGSSKRPKLPLDLSKLPDDLFTGADTIRHDI